jgi:rhodanese-related sulfurtransferase
MTDQPAQGHFRAIDIDSYRTHFQPGDHTLVDVRELEEWVTGHIPGAIHIPLNDLPDHLAEIDPQKPVVVVCASGVRSLYGAQFLLGNGYPEVYSLDDGTKGWVKKRLPLER